MQPPTKIQQAEGLLGEDLGAWVLRHRADDRSWRWIADKLAAQTRVFITAEWLRQTYAEAIETGLSPIEAAEAAGVTVESLDELRSAGLLSVYYTASGHPKFLLSELRRAIADAQRGDAA